MASSIEVGDTEVVEQVLVVPGLVKGNIESRVKCFADGVKTGTTPKKPAIRTFLYPFPTLLPISMASVIQIYVGFPVSFPPAFYAYLHRWEAG